MKEIGGYLELDRFAGQEYYSGAIALNTARNAVVCLAKEKHIEKLYIPYFLCDSVSCVCDREKIDYEYYHIDEHFCPVFDKSIRENEYLYVVNFYGQLDIDTIQRIHKRYPNMILDNVQAFFEPEIPGIATIYSCRKFFGVPDGAYLICEDIHPELPIDVSGDRMTHVLGRFEGESASDYYAAFQANDAAFETLPLMFMSKLTHNLLGALDYNSIRVQRENNWSVLHDALKEKNRLQLRSPNGPYMYPFYCENGMEIKKRLAAKKIFIPTLWPNVLSFDGCELEKDYAQNILPLPCDQRYTKTEMDYLIKEITHV